MQPVARQRPISMHVLSPRLPIASIRNQGQTVDGHLEHRSKICQAEETQGDITT